MSVTIDSIVAMDMDLVLDTVSERSSLGKVVKAVAP